MIENIIIIAVIIAAIALIAVIASRSIRIMNASTIIHSFATMVLAGYALSTVKLPLFFLKNRYFFLDALGIYEIFITGCIFFLAAIYAKGYMHSLIKAGELDPKNAKLFYVVFNLLLLSVVLAFSANNLALLWIFVELTTVLSAILIVVLNAKENITAAIKYVFITSTAMIFSFMGLILLFFSSRQGLEEATLNWDMLLQGAQQLPPQLLLFSFVLIFVGFAAKSGVAPFHTWLPAAYSKAPSDVSVLLSGSVSMIGVYAILRIYSLTAHTVVHPFASKFLLAFGVLSIGIAALSMLVRTNVKKIIAFSSIEHVGIMLLGMGIGNIVWMVYHLLAHALAKALLFFSAGIIHRQYQSNKIEAIYNLFELQPFASWGLIIGSAAVIGMPLLPLFISKFFILADLANVSLLLLLAVLVLLLIASGSFAWFMIQMMQIKENVLPKYRAPASMKMALFILIALLLALGLYVPDKLYAILEKIVVQLGL